MQKIVQFFQMTEDVGSMQGDDEFSSNHVGQSSANDGSAESVKSNHSELSAITLSSEDSGISFDSNLKYKFWYEFAFFIFCLVE